jgi:hypothetical protein
MSQQSVPRLVVQAGRALYGDQWRSGIAQSLDLHPRTVRRIGQAARLDDPHPISPGVLMELAALARETAVTLERGRADGRSQIRCLQMLAHELDEAARGWTPTRRARKSDR